MVQIFVDLVLISGRIEDSIWSNCIHDISRLLFILERQKIIEEKGRDVHKNVEVQHLRQRKAISLQGTMEV